MTSSLAIRQQSTTGAFQVLADAIVQRARQPAAQANRYRLATSADLATASRSYDLPTTQSPAQSLLSKLTDCQAVAHSPQLSEFARLPGNYVTFGPYQIVPACGSEVAIGRDYQAIPYDSISRLHGYIGQDEYGFYIREVPEVAQLGLKPSRHGIWVRHCDEHRFKRLVAGQAERITIDSEVRIGGNGSDPETGVPLVVHL